VTARRAVVTGRVQGVGYRFFAERIARELGIAGWVRNLPDGSVETLAEGEEDALSRFLERLRRGPLASRVDSVVVEERQAQGLVTFEITS
jgi:acylphosphatase